MSYDYSRAILYKICQSLLYQPFRFRVERRGGFVQNQHGRVRQDCSRDGYALALAAR
jgi:hypothetical protein